MLSNMVYDDISNIKGPICSGYIPLHHVEFVLRLHALLTYLENLKLSINGMIQAKKFWRMTRFKPRSLEEKNFLKQVFFHWASWLRLLLNFISYIKWTVQSLHLLALSFCTVPKSTSSCDQDKSLVQKSSCSKCKFPISFTSGAKIVWRWWTIMLLNLKGL